MKKGILCAVALVAVAVVWTCATQSSAQETSEKEKRTLEERVIALEKELAELKKIIQTVQDGQPQFQVAAQGGLNAQQCKLLRDFCALVAQINGLQITFKPGVGLNAQNFEAEGRNAAKVGFYSQRVKLKVP